MHILKQNKMPKFTDAHCGLLVLQSAQIPLPGSWKSSSLTLESSSLMDSGDKLVCESRLRSPISFTGGLLGMRLLGLVFCLCALCGQAHSKVARRRYPKHGYRSKGGLRALPDWAKEAIEKGKESEKQKWEMFGDDGTLKRTSVKSCEDLKYAASRVREFPATVKHVPITDSAKGSPRILCWIFTSIAFHETKAKAVKLTWGKRCDGLLFISNWEDKLLPSIVLKENKEDSFDNLW